MEESRSSVPTSGWLEQAATPFLANLLLSAVCLSSARQTFQINRGAAAGFLLQALGPLLEATLLLSTCLGLGLQWAWPPDYPWASTVVGLPLLAFGFHWLNGDCSTANVLLGGALLLAGSWDHFSEEGRALATSSVTSVAAITILIVSIFTGNSYGIAGSLLVGATGLLEGAGLWPLPAQQQRDALRCPLAVANLALCRALRAQQQELSNSWRGGLATAAH